MEGDENLSLESSVLINSSYLYKHKMLATNPSRAINKAILEELTFDRPDSKLSNTS